MVDDGWSTGKFQNSNSNFSKMQNLENTKRQKKMRQEIQTKQLEDDLERMYMVVSEKLGKAESDQLREAHRQLMEIRAHNNSINHQQMSHT